MKKEKLNLKDLSVTSFVTNDKAKIDKLRGGSDPDPCPTAYSNCSCPEATCGVYCGTNNGCATETCDPLGCQQTNGYTGACIC